LKFPKPKILLENEFPDLNLDHPSLIKSIVDTVKPEPNSATDIFISASIQYLKEQQRKKSVTLNNSFSLGSHLPFADILFNNQPLKVKALLDSGATNSLIHTSFARKLKLKVTPCNMSLNTANGSSQNAIKGIAHVTFHLLTSQKEKISFCTNLIVTTQLNGLQAIIGAEFLLDPQRVKSISGKILTVVSKNKDYDIPVQLSNMHHANANAPDNDLSDSPSSPSAVTPPPLTHKMRTDC
jgi:hypothetical protein